MKQRLLFSLVSILLLGTVIWIFWPTKKSLAPTATVNTTTAVNIAANVDVPTNTVTNLIDFSIADLPDRDPAFSFNVSIPKTWRAEYVPAAKAINLYDSQAGGKSNLERSMIFITYYSAEEFTAPLNMDIKSQSEATINKLATKTYIVQKNSDRKKIVGQPAWLDLEHRITDIRTTDAKPTIFYSLAIAPGLSDAQLSTFLASLSMAN